MTDLNKLRSEFEALPEIKAHLDHGNVFWSNKNQTYASEFQCLHAVACYVNGAWFMFQEKAKTQAVPEKKIYLTCEQLYAAANFGAPNRDPELLETELTIAWFDEAHSGSGYYVYISEYPEEGAMKLESESGAEG